MEFIIGAAVIILLLLILGVPPMMIVLGALSLVELFLLLMALFFVISLILLMMTKPTEAKYLRIDPNEGVGTHAVYWMDDREYDNSFPAEIMFVDKIYHEGKICKIRIWKSRKDPEKYILLDWYSVIVIAVGLPVFSLMAGLGLAGLLLMWSVIQ
ncbi:MAG: hypothetical protein IJ642_08940 [Oscillospiraceae bacterium]|nr:hypothetical protein [Oscillospiraceae bacterium]